MSGKVQLPEFAQGEKKVINTKGGRGRLGIPRRKDNHFWKKKIFEEKSTC